MSGLGHILAVIEANGAELWLRTGAAHHADRRLHPHRHRNRHSAWHLRGQARLGGAAAARRRRHSADRAESRHAGASARHAAADRRVAGDHRADALCAASHRAQHGDGPARHRAGDPGGRARRRHDGGTAIAPCRAAAGASRRRCRRAHGRRGRRRHCDAVRLHRRGRSRPVHQSRAGTLQHRPDPARRHSFGAARARCRRLYRRLPMGNRDATARAGARKNLGDPHSHSLAGAYPSHRCCSLLVDDRQRQRPASETRKPGKARAA